MEDEHYTPAEIAIPLALNFIFSVSCVLVNKFLFRMWKFGVALTSLHFTVTFAALAIMCFRGDFKFKKLLIRKVIPLSASFCASIALNNLSIQYNSVGFYQTMKISSMPMVCVMEYFWLGSRFSTRIKFSLVVVIAGILLCTVQDFRTVLLFFLSFHFDSLFFLPESSWLHLWSNWGFWLRTLCLDVQDKTEGTKLQLPSASFIRNPDFSHHAVNSCSLL